MQIVVVNRHTIAANRKKNERKSPLRLSNGRHGRPRYHSNIEFNGRGRIVYEPDHPLPCGATVWVEFDDGDLWNKDTAE